MNPFDIEIEIDLLDNAGLGFFLNNGSIANENEIFAFLKKIVKPEDVFYDVGSNIGLYTLFLSNKCKIYSFEPNYDLASRLIYALQNLNNVKIFNIALSDNDGEILFHLLNENSSLSSLRKINKSTIIKVKSLKIDSVISQFDILYPTILKIDVEGYEYFVLKGFSRLNDLKPLVIFEWSESFGKELNILFSDLLSVFTDDWKIFRFETTGLLRENEIVRPMTTNNLLAVHKDDKRYDLICNFALNSVFQ